MPPATIPTNQTMLSSITRPNRKTTADKPLLSTSKTIKEHAKGMGIKTNITSLTAARKLLSTHGLTSPTAGNMLQSISAALFEFTITANLGATHSEILCAIAYLIYEVDKDIDTENIIVKIKALIGGPIALLDEKVDTFAETLDAHKTKLENTITEVQANLQTSTEGLGKVVENVTTITANCRHSPNSAAGSDGPKTYATAVKTNIPPPLTKVMTRNEAQSRHILVDRHSPVHPNSLRELTEAQLVKKASLAIELMEKESIETPKELTFISARRLQHGGILYELNSPEAAAWFNTPANKSQFLNHFGPEIVIKERTFHVLVENVPISFMPSNLAAITDIEKKAGLKPRSISRTHYIKPEAQHHPNQHTAHTIFTFSTKEGANHAIKFGLSVEGKKVYRRKLIPEPTRCLKCHSLDRNHIAAACPQEDETCGMCSEAHRTSLCTITDQNSFHCKNCDTKGHAAWSCECPTFKTKWEAYKDQNKDAKY